MLPIPDPSALLVITNKDLIFLNFINFYNRINETVITFFDMINGDQMMVVAKKIK